MISPIEIPSRPHLGLEKFLTLTGCSSELTYVTWNQSIYNCIKILLTMIVWPLLLLCCLVLAAYMKCKLFIFQYWCRSKLEYELYIILLLIQKLWQKWQESTNSKFVRKMMLNDLSETFRSNIRLSSWCNIQYQNM